MTTHKQEPEHAHAPAHAAKPTVATASTAAAAMPPGDPTDYVQAWVEAEEQSIPDADGQTHTVKVSKLGWVKK